MQYDILQSDNETGPWATVKLDDGGMLNFLSCILQWRCLSMVDRNFNGEREGDGNLISP